ncbi:hypothetical protein [Leptospira sp. 'Mane']|uniref:hypothetical protein n=1 Tax=Leptospira sp. 'Mane' TaxID=3387407 RepID=UPI00398BACA9
MKFYGIRKIETYYNDFLLLKKMLRLVNLQVISFVFIVSCMQNYGVKNSSLIQIEDAEAEYSFVLFLKEVEYYPRDAIYFPQTLHPVESCRRNIYYNKNEFKDCMKQVSLANFNPESFSDLLLKVDLYIHQICKLKKVIFLKDSISKGELNTCELNM